MHPVWSRVGHGILMALIRGGIAWHRAHIEAAPISGLSVSDRKRTSPLL